VSNLRQNSEAELLSQQLMYQKQPSSVYDVTSIESGNNKYPLSQDGGQRAKKLDNRAKMQLLALGG
jgi:hypothetical protein